MNDFVAACMEPDEWRLWQQANRRITGFFGEAQPVDRPCDECPLSFALEMRAVDRCNGEPMGEPEDEQEDEPMEMARISAQRVSVQVNAPCPTCLHREVCAIKADVDGAGNAEVGLRSLNPALTPRLTVDLECAFYLRERGAKVPPQRSRNALAGASGWTEERKAKWNEQMAARRAAKAAEREAAEAA